MTETNSRVYLGRPENQRDPKAVNQHIPLVTKTSAKPPRAQPPPTRPKPVVPPPATAEQANLKSGSPFDESIFGRGLSVREVDTSLSFSPSTPTLIETSRAVYNRINTDDPNLGKRLLPEYVDYYTTFLLWSRLITLKSYNQHNLTEAEQWLYAILKDREYSVPSPISVILKSIGNVTTSLGQHLEVRPIDLPTTNVGSRPGYYGAISAVTHNLYEELPNLGVLAEAVSNAISNNPPGPYTSVLNIAGATPNQHLLGYKPLLHRRAEAKNLGLIHGFSDLNVNEGFRNTAINISFINSISDELAKTSTYKVEKINFIDLTKTGHVSQTIVSTPIELTIGSSDINGELIASSLTQERDSSYGVAVFTCFQLFKSDSPDRWLCITPSAEFDIQPYDENKNTRRDLPPQYYNKVFAVVSQSGDNFRRNIISNMVT